MRGVWRRTRRGAPVSSEQCWGGSAGGRGERTLAWGSSAWPSSAQSRRLKDGSTAIYRVHSSVVIALTLHNWSKQSLGASRSTRDPAAHNELAILSHGTPDLGNIRTIINLFNEGCSRLNRAHVVLRNKVKVIHLCDPDYNRKLTITQLIWLRLNEVGQCTIKRSCFVFVRCIWTLNCDYKTWTDLFNRLSCLLELLI